MTQIWAYLPCGSIKNDNVTVTSNSIKFADPDDSYKILNYHFDYIFKNQDQLFQNWQRGKSYTVLTVYTEDYSISLSKMKNMAYRFYHSYTLLNDPKPHIAIGTISDNKVFNSSGSPASTPLLSPEPRSFDYVFGGLKPIQDSAFIFRIGVSPAYFWILSPFKSLCHNLGFIRAQFSPSTIDLRFEPLGNPDQNKKLLNLFKSSTFSQVQSQKTPSKESTKDHTRTPRKTPSKNVSNDPKDYNWWKFITHNKDGSISRQRLIYVAQQASFDPQTNHEELIVLSRLLDNEISECEKFKSNLQDVIESRQNELKGLKLLSTKYAKEILDKEKEIRVLHIGNMNKKRNEEERTIGNDDDYEFAESCLEDAIDKAIREVEYLKTITCLNNSDDGILSTEEEDQESDNDNEEEESDSNNNAEEETRENQEEEEKVENNEKSILHSEPKEIEEENLNENPQTNYEFLVEEEDLISEPNGEQII